MTDLSRSIAVKPIITYPREAQVGKTYLMTIDLQPDENFEWHYDEEEYPIYCSIDSDLFNSKPVGEPVVVLHRFGGSYGASSFLLTAVLEEIHGSIQIGLVNRWGVTTKVISLEQVKVVNEKLEDIANPISTFSGSRAVKQETDTRKRSRKLALTDWTQANNALHQYFRGSKSQLADHLDMSRTTVTAFFKQQPVREAEFRKLCLALRLNWENVSAIKATPLQSEGVAVESPASQANNNFEALVQQVREHCRQKILTQHSRMRLLSGEEIGVDQLYVDVWLLNRSPRTFQVSQDKLLRTFDLRNDRLGLGDRIKRNSGFEIASANAKLVILGKPGSGKTTFLKHLAVDWCKGQFQPDLIAVFIEFRRIQDGQWKLVDAIGKELGLKDQNQIKELLQQGRLLVLMDGLGEVPTNELRRNVQDQLREMAEKYVNNRWVLTCRTQIITSIPDKFISVEVADFSPEQVRQFVQNWLQASGKLDVEATRQEERFSNAVNNNSALKELTVTPVLLSLVCLVFQDEGGIPAQVAWLYQKGIKLLLSRWNEDKQIYGWEVGSKTYRGLSVAQKEALLVEIAARNFENPENFVLFEQNEIATQIAEFLHLANLKEGVAVLKAIEAQHGLLIERADELWSFSHLTFQEYFTVQWLIQLPSAQLAEKIANQRWQEVVKQLAKSQQPADRLIRLIKQAIDRLIANEPVVNEFLAQRTEQLRQVIKENQDISYDSQLIDSQIQLFQRYYNANKFLLDLMNIEGAVSQEVKAEIEYTLLLPWDELQRRQPDVYGQTQPTSPSLVRVFIAYSHEDEDLRKELDRHLANLKRQDKIQAWHRGAIEAGAEWDAAIKQQLETAQIILLLVSTDFIASNDCYDLLQQSLQRHSAGTARVIPIILKPTDLQSSPFNHLSSLPTDGRPITLWHNRDEAFLNVVEGIRGAIELLVR